MNRLQLKQVSPFSYAFWGTFDYIKDVSKKVTIDGEVYTNVKREIIEHVISDCDYDFGDYNGVKIEFLDLEKFTHEELKSVDITNFYELDIFDVFNLPTIRVFTPENFTPSFFINNLYGAIASQNNYAHLLNYFLKYPPECWKDFVKAHEFKDHDNRTELFKEGIIVEYLIFQYGSGNSIDIELYAHEIVMYNYREISKKIRSYDTKYNYHTGKWDRIDRYTELGLDMTEDQKIIWVNKWVEKLSFYTNSTLPPDSNA